MKSFTVAGAGGGRSGRRCAGLRVRRERRGGPRLLRRGRVAPRDRPRRRNLIREAALSFFGAGTFRHGFLASRIGSTSNLGIYTANTERLRISPTGNIGIGTITPGAPLEVRSGGFGAAHVRLSYSSIIFHDIVSNWHGGSPTTNYLQFRVYDVLGGTGSQTTVMTLNGAGNVGIGTSATTAKLDNAGDTYRQRPPARPRLHRPLETRAISAGMPTSFTSALPPTRGRAQP